MSALFAYDPSTGFQDEKSVNRQASLNIHLNFKFGVYGYLFRDVATDVNENLLLLSRGPGGLMS